ncbi:MAG: acetyl-CoA C-acyltransferase [Negativicutes bacterium]
MKGDENLNEVVITHAVRTAVGKIGGSLKNVSEIQLAATVFRAIIDRSGLDPAIVDHVIMGDTKQSTRPANIARCGWLAAGLPDTVPAYSLVRACCSGSQSIFDGYKLIAAGDADIVIAGGVESLSNNPYFLRNVRSGFGVGDAVFVDSLTENAYGHSPINLFGDVSLLTMAENCAEKYHVDREAQDEFALRSQQVALDAIRRNAFKDEIVPINGFEVDEYPRETSMEQLRNLPPVRKGGTVTAGNASGRNDGAACVMLMSRAMADILGYHPGLRYIGATVTGIHPAILGISPIDASRKLLKKTGLRLKDMDLIELNEAYASQSVAVIREWANWDEDETYESVLARTNVNGSGISIGHPPGATGAILTTKLFYAMQNLSNARYCMVTMCVGGGMGFAAIMEKCGGGTQQ